MKKLILITLASMLCVSLSYSQKGESQKWSAGLSAGINSSLTEDIALLPGGSLNFKGNVQYKLKSNFGLMLNLGYGSLDTEKTTGAKTNLLAGSLELTYNLGGLLNTSKFGILLHAGPGLSSMWNPDMSAVNPTDPYFKGQDDMITLNCGVIPSYKISDNLNLILDFSFTSNFLQDHSFDYSPTQKQKSILFTSSIGLSYSFGKAKSNANPIKEQTK